MSRNKQTVDESINKIKFMINYDSSKTLTEQGTLGGNIPADTFQYEPPSQEEKNLKGRGSSYRPRNPMDKLINFYETYRDILDKTPRGVDDNVINDHAKKLFDNMKGLRMNHKIIPAIFQDMRTPSDVIALIDEFNSRYGQRQDLKKWLSREWTSSNVEMKTADALKNIIINYKNQQTNEPKTGFDITKPEPIKGPIEKPRQSGYKFVAGTTDDPYKYGTLGSGIAQLQQNLGLVQDGKWGPKTNAKIKELAPQYINGFTNADLLKVIQSIRSKTTPENATPIKPIAQLSPRTVAPKQPESKLAEQVRSGEMAAKTAKGAAIAAGGGWLAGPAVAGYMGAPAAVSAVAGTAGAAVAGIAALGLIPLILWLNDKDKVYSKVAKLFNYLEKNKEKIDQVPRGLDDETIWDLSDTLYNAMKRLGTKEKDVYKVFDSLQTISDLGALISFYNEDNDVPLLKQLNRDFDMTKEWMRIYRPIRNLVLKFSKEMEAKGEEIQQKQGTEDGKDGATPAAVAGSLASTSGYKFVKGTSDDPYKYGTLGSGIAQVQQNLGVVQDGKWGPKTDAKMKELAPEYTGGYTNDDLVKIIQAIRSKKNPALQKSTAPTAPTLAPKTPMKLAPMAQQIQPTKKELRKLVRLRT